MSYCKKLISIMLAVLMLSNISISVFATVSAHEGTEEVIESTDQDLLEEESSNVETDESGAPIESDTAESDSSENEVNDTDDSESAQDSLGGTAVDESTDEEIQNTETADTQEENSDESYEVIGQITETENSVSNMLTIAGMVLIAIGVIGMLVVIIWMVKSKKTKEDQTKQDVYTAVNMAKAKVQPSIKTVPTTTRVYNPVGIADELNKKLDFSKPEIAIEKEVPKKKVVKSSSKYDTQDILNEFLK